MLEMMDSILIIWIVDTQFTEYKQYQQIEYDLYSFGNFVEIL